MGMMLVLESCLMVAAPEMALVLNRILAGIDLSPTPSITSELPLLLREVGSGHVGDGCSLASFLHQEPQRNGHIEESSLL